MEATTNNLIGFQDVEDQTQLPQCVNITNVPLSQQIVVVREYREKVTI